MDWNQCAAEVEVVAAQVRAAGYSADIIIGIVRGGMVPSRLLSTALKVKEMYAINVKKVGGERKVTTAIKEDLQGKKVLLVEDMLETGRSLAVAKAHLEAEGASVRTACLYTMPITEVPVDFCVKEVAEVRSFPWEVAPAPAAPAAPAPASTWWSRVSRKENLLAVAVFLDLLAVAMVVPLLPQRMVRNE